MAIPHPQISGNGTFQVEQRSSGGAWTTYQQRQEQQQGHEGAAPGGGEVREGREDGAVGQQVVQHGDQAGRGDGPTLRPRKPEGINHRAGWLVHGE